MLFALPRVALADADDHSATVDSTKLGLQPISAPYPAATSAPVESRSFQRPDGAYQAIPEVRSHIKTFHLVERPAPWTLKPGLTVMANTYNGVVPGPTIVVRQGDTVVIDYTNASPIADTIHLHGIHDIPVSMDGVGGISQPLVQPGGRFTYRFVAKSPGTFIYHTHGMEALLDSGLYGAIIVQPSNPPRELAEDFLEVISSWQIQSGSENRFTLNGKEYPATRALDVHAGDLFKIRWINISGEEFHTMHTHGHDQQIIMRDGSPVETREVEDTVLIGPGQRTDVLVRANARPGTWLTHCHVADHMEDDMHMPSGLITAIHYLGTPNTLPSLYPAMAAMARPAASAPKPLSFGMTVLLGAIAGFTIFLGLPVARARWASPKTIALLNALAIGILLYLVIEIAENATIPVSRAVTAWHGGSATFPFALAGAFVGGLLIGLVGLGSLATYFTRSLARQAENPMVLAAIVALGIGAHNFGEGLAIGASAAAGTTAVALALIVGFGLHNATEGFGVAAPLVGRVVPSWFQIGVAGLIAGGPTFLGTVIGYRFTSPVLTVFFLTIAVGALAFVIGELWSFLRRTGLTPLITTMVTAGFLVAFATELFLDANGG